MLVRAAVVIAAGVLAGLVYGHFREQSSPLVLRAKEAAPLDIGKYMSPAPESPKDARAPATGSKPGEPQAPGGGQTTGATPPTPPSPPPPTQPKPDPVGLHVTVPQAKLLYDNKIAFVDARHLEEYEAGHVDNAFLLSSDDVTGGKGTEVLGYLDKEAPIVVYCNGGACDASENLVKVMQVMGYHGCRIMTDGYPAWEKAGYPTAKGRPMVGGGG
jgi:rhodanese-related sulfurtransferase